jgi:pyridoxine 4-dehydrogenase
MLIVSPQHIRSNAATVPLDEAEMEAVDAIIKSHPVAGDRFHPVGMKMMNL